MTAPPAAETITVGLAAFASAPSSDDWTQTARALEARAPSQARARPAAEDDALCADLAALAQARTARTQARFLTPAQGREALDAATTTWTHTPFGVARARSVGDALVAFDYAEAPDPALITTNRKHPIARLFAGETIETWFIGSPLGLAVWRALFAIPLGETRSYGALAADLGSSPRAVGGRVGSNPISWLAPCHRVVGSDGTLTGYGGGLTRKRAMLALERITARRAAPHAGAGANVRSRAAPSASMA